MSQKIEDIILHLQTISKDSRITELRIIEKTKSILKARLLVSENVFIQVYVNVKRSKRSYALIINDSRIFGKDYLFGEWHSHPFESPDRHDISEKARRFVAIEDFAAEALFILSDKMNII